MTMMASTPAHNLTDLHSAPCPTVTAFPCHQSSTTVDQRHRAILSRFSSPVIMAGFHPSQEPGRVYDPQRLWVARGSNGLEVNLPHAVGKQQGYPGPQG